MNLQLWNNELKYLSGRDSKKFKRSVQSFGSKLSLKGRKEAERGIHNVSPGFNYINLS